MNQNNRDRSELWKHIHGEVDAAEAEAFRARAEQDQDLRRELDARTQLNARFRHLLKVSALNPAALEEKIGELWEEEQAQVAAKKRKASKPGLLIQWRPALIALAASLMLVVGSYTMRPDGLVWMAPNLSVGPSRGQPGAEEVFYSKAELRGYARSLQESVAATYCERNGPSGWIARWTGRQRAVRTTLRPFPDGRILATVEVFRSPREAPIGTWSESFSNAEDFKLNAGDWAGRIAEEIISGSTGRD